MTPDTVRAIIVDTAIATIYAMVAVIAFVAAARWRGSRGRIPAALLGWALLQHAINQIAGSEAIQDNLGGPSRVVLWADLVTAYFVAAPWAMLMERLIGTGWRKSVRRTWQTYLASAIACVAFDVVRGEPGAAIGFNRVVVGAGAFVGFANLFATKTGLPRQMLLLRGGILIFLAFVVHDAMAGAGMLPWRRNTGPLGVLVCVAAIGYAVIAHTLRAQRELRAVEHELATARRIQSSILPESAPVLEGAVIVHRYVPAAAVAGDIFDFIGADPRHVGILVADVSGHGVPAALIASMVKVAAAAQTPHADDPARVLAGIHLALAGELPRAHFVTASYVFVDLERRLLRHASAGHPPPLVWRAAARSFLPPFETGPLIAACAPPAYPIAESPLGAGDRIVLYTDGITEAMRPDEEMFGEDRLRAVVATASDGANALASAVIDAAAAFRGRNASGFDDDCTLVVVEVG